ncbi:MULTISPECIES: glutamine amidotransferase [unclassified Rhizobium]|uniref:glutamine amidotransferase n=1 Tax=unclassified Rhizobium TaxID=2613769 RepID=UPI001ADB2D9F|nr:MULTISPECIES: glutamine amidotransferase [unclassified Rhizobium]MBO9127822.1 glutamine amidotransferase [Rhizobium sp. 16-488-2b]MBO9176954.1 glutamine amidotransferase [Rhizobium sp. 16-488-2a]
MTRTVLALRHVHFEDLGLFADTLMEAGYDIQYSDVGDLDFCAGDPRAPDLLVILGGPIGVYDDHYPFLQVERAFIRARLEGGLPTLGICLGAQLIAATLGEKVFPTGLKEIGFSKLMLTDEGMASPLRHLEDVHVLHWHGDTYGLPLGAANLASSALVEQQAFSIGENLLGLQFHPEAETDQSFERWLVGHAAELGSAGIDIAALRRDAALYGPPLAAAARALLREWLAGLKRDLAT